MAFIRRNFSEDLSPRHCSPTSSNNTSSSDTSPGKSQQPKEALHYLPDFLDVKLGSVNAGYFSSLLTPLSSSFKLQELKARDVLEQELKMKQEHTAKGRPTCLIPTATQKMTATAKTAKPSKKRAPTPDSDSDCSRSSGRRFRTQFTPTQLDLLKTTFQASKYLSLSLRQQVHEMTGIPKDNIKVWFQNRRAREKRRSEKSNRTVVSSSTKSDATVTSTSSPPSSSSSTQQPVSMTTMSMQWPEDSSATTISSSSAPPPRYHPYMNQWTTPGLQNRRNWYWADAYQPMEAPHSTTTTSSAPTSTLPSMVSFKSSDGMLYPLPQIPVHASDFETSTSSPGLSELPVSVASSSLVNPDDMHPRSDNVLQSL